MLELAAQNAKIVLRQDKDRIKREEERTTGALKEIEGWLNLTHIDRIEAYDISNTSGMESVGSMVVFEGGKPKETIIESSGSKVCRVQMTMLQCMRC